MALSLSAAAQCRDIANGHFNAGLAGWTTDPVTRHTGQAFANANAQVVDSTPFGRPLIGPAAMLSTFAHALGDQSGFKHQASAALTLSTVTVVTNRVLTFEALGSWEVLRAGAATGTYAFRVEVVGVNGGSAARTFFSLNSLPALPCGVSMSILGNVADDEPFMLDVLFDDGTPTGIDIGDSVAVRVTLECAATALTECDELEFGAAVLVDDFAFCRSRDCLADVNHDNQVNVDDLVAVILGWGACPAPPALCEADINADGLVNVDDLIAVILGWGECP
jgi:hypothetical protein